VQLEDREVECAGLESLITGARDGRGGVIVLEGPSGAGKSALLAWLAARSEGAGIRAVAVRATPLGAEVPFGLARRLLEPAVRAAPSLLDAGWARRARPLFAGDVAGPGVAPLLTEGLVAIVGQLVTAHGPAVLAADDLQWADAWSAGFLVEVAQRAPELGLGLAVAINTAEEVADPVSLARLRALAGRVIAPAPLSPAAVGRLIEQRTPGRDAAFAARLASAAAGNPQLVTELLDAAAGGEEVADAVPASVRRRLLARLLSAGGPAQALAHAVAVLGEAPLHRAAELAGLSDADADTAADELIARHLLVAGEPVRFRQPIVGDALAATVAPFALAARHRRAAELLARDGADDLAIAVHLARSRPARDDWTAAVLRRAARASLLRGDPGCAVRLLERATEEPPPADQRGAMLLELARARAAAGQPEAIGAFQRVLGQVEDRAARSAAWHGLSRRLYLRGDHPLAAAAAADGRAELAPSDPMHERLLSDELAAASLTPELAAEAAARTEAIIGAAPPSDPALLAHLIVHQAWRGLHVDQLPALAGTAVAADPLVDPESGGLALSFVAGALNMIDRTPQSCELLDAGLERAAALGDPLAEVSLRCCRAWARIFQGDLALAERDLTAVATMNELGWPAVTALSGPPLVVLRLELADLAGAREALGVIPVDTRLPGRAWFVGAVAAAAGDHTAALDAFEAAGAQLEGILGMGNPAVLPWRSSAALEAIHLGRPDRARELLAPELVQATALGVPRAQGIALRVAGLLEGDPTLLERSVAALEGSPARLELARSLMWLGVAYRRARRAREARLPLVRALDLAGECGATALQARTTLELEAAGARPRRRPRYGRDALTASERNVARLAATGMTTRQIAAELYLTPKTVEGHLTRAFRKLGISSRGELAGVLSRGVARDDR
jgi:DNA-binding CsgD family transcriptional regulator